MRVLVVEDEPRMAALLVRGLTAADFDVSVARSGEQALARVEDEEPEAIVLDVMLGGIDGIETCRRLRGRGIWTPVLMLTAKDGIEERVVGLEAGADDYLGKPFAFAELIARLRSMMRRRPVDRETPLIVGEVALDRDRRSVRIAAEETALSPREADLLEAFLRHPGQVLSRRQLGEHAWSYDYDGTSNVVDVYVRYLRAKIGAERIETVRGSGYRWRT